MRNVTVRIHGFSSSHTPTIDVIFLFSPFSARTNQTIPVLRNAQAPPAGVPRGPARPELPAGPGPLHGPRDAGEQRGPAAANQPKRAAHRSLFVQNCAFTCVTQTPKQ